MTTMQILFILFAAFTLGTALMVVSSRKLINAALWLVAALFGVAMLYVLLEAEFLAVAQIVVYIGAIAVLFIFAVMLTRRELRDEGPTHNKGWGVAVLISVLTFAGLTTLLTQWSGWDTQAAAIPENFDAVDELGVALLSPDAYVLPFEVASILLVAAMIGAVYLAAGKSRRDNE